MIDPHRLQKIRNKIPIFVIFLTLLLPTASGWWYIIGEKESGWNTGIRDSTTLSFGLSGFSAGNGSYGRYGEISLNDVKVRDRTSSANGTLDYREYMGIVSSVEEGVMLYITKHPGDQDFHYMVNETMPSHITAARTLDFTGRRINDIEYFGNNFEYAGSSYLYATDLRKDTYADMNLSNVHFYAIINNTSKKILLDEFIPNLTMQYNHRSSFTGFANLRFKHSQDRKPAAIGDDTYWGSFRVMRSMNTTGRDNLPRINDTWENYFEELDCCGELAPWDEGTLQLLKTIHVEKVA